MQIERNIEILHDFPEGPILWKIIVHHGFRIPFPVAVDRASADGPIPQTMHAYAMQGTPTSLLIDRAGRLRKKVFGVESDRQMVADIDTLIAEPA